MRWDWCAAGGEWGATSRAPRVNCVALQVFKANKLTAPDAKMYEDAVGMADENKPVVVLGRSEIDAPHVEVISTYPGYTRAVVAVYMKGRPDVVAFMAENSPGRTNIFLTVRGRYASFRCIAD